MKRRESRTRTKKVTLRQTIETLIQAATVEVFHRFDQETIDLDTLVYFVLQSFSLTTETYSEFYQAVKEHIVENFAVSQGPMRRREDLSVRHTLVTYVPPRKMTAPPKISVKPDEEVRYPRRVTPRSFKPPKP